MKFALNDYDKVLYVRMHFHRIEMRKSLVHSCLNSTNPDDCRADSSDPLALCQQLVILHSDCRYASSLPSAWRETDF